MLISNLRRKVLYFPLLGVGFPHTSTNNLYQIVILQPYYNKIIKYKFKNPHKADLKFIRKSGFALLAFTWRKVCKGKRTNTRRERGRNTGGMRAKRGGVRPSEQQSSSVFYKANGGCSFPSTMLIFQTGSKQAKNGTFFFPKR